MASAEIQAAVRPAIDRAEFDALWEAESPHGDFSPAAEAGLAAVHNQINSPEIAVSEVRFTDVTLRDGQQQQMNEVTVEERIEVFEGIVRTGVDRIEIGHLGNANGDQQLAAALVAHIAEAENRGDGTYDGIKLQVLFGTQEEGIEEGSGVLRDAFARHYPDTWEEEMAERVVVHVYDRVDPNLLNTASEPYTMQDSAFRIATGAAHAQSAGFKHFSISGEATTAIEPEAAIQFYRSVTGTLFDNGADSVNVNLPNTYGYSLNGEWNTGTLTAFNVAVKHGFDERVSTSMHSHNDVDNAVDVAIGALVAGFDRVEGTHIGVGERTGNTANVDVAARLLEFARHQIIRMERHDRERSRFTQYAGQNMLKRTVMVDSKIIDNFDNFYEVGESMAEIFGPHAAYRWHRTAVGNPYAHDNGSGPHDQVMAAAITDPVTHAGDRAYEWALLTHSALGRPETEAIAIGDPQAVDAITVGNFAGGRKTAAIKEGAIDRASAAQVSQAQAEFRARKQQLLDALRGGVEIVSG
jgi:isopropylmalate/homocitrate/citramalate synthase